MLNNPLKYTDSTGHWIDEGGGFATNKKKNTGLKIVSGRRVGNSDGDGIFVPNFPVCERPPAVLRYPDQGFDPTAPWSLDRLDAVGIRFDIISIWLIVLGGDVSADLIYNPGSQQTSLIVNFTGMGGVGFGTDTGGGILLAYDTGFNSDLGGESIGAQGAVATPFGGLQASYSYSITPNVMGRHAQAYFLGTSHGAEGSGGATRGYSIPIFDIGPCTFGGCNK